MRLSTEDSTLSKVGSSLLAATVYTHFQFTHAQTRALRRWYRLKYGITVNDRRRLCREFISEAIKNQWLLVDVETETLDPDDTPQE